MYSYLTEAYFFTVSLLLYDIHYLDADHNLAYDVYGPPYEIGQAIIFLPCGFFLLLSFFLSFFSLPNLSGRILDVYHASTHGVVLVRIWNAGLKCATRGWKCRTQKIAIWAPSHNFVRLYLCS